MSLPNQEEPRYWENDIAQWIFNVDPEVSQKYVVMLKLSKASPPIMTVADYKAGKGWQLQKSQSVVAWLYGLPKFAKV